MKITLALMSLILITASGCVGSLNYENISSQLGYKEWIGKKIELKEEILIVENSQYTEKFLVEPHSQFYPTIKEFRETGKSKINWFSNNKVVAIAERGKKFEIIAVGYYVFSTTMGKTGIVILQDTKDNVKYCARETDLFSFENNNIRPHPDFIEILPAPLPVPDEKK